MYLEFDTIYDQVFPRGLETYFLEITEVCFGLFALETQRPKNKSQILDQNVMESEANY